MANSVYFENCLRAIRHTVYGRDNRKPIADAIRNLVSYHEKCIVEITENAIITVNGMYPVLDKMEQKLQRAASFSVEPTEMWYTYDHRDIELQNAVNDEYTAEAVTDKLTVYFMDEASWGSFDISFNDADFTFNDPPQIGDGSNYRLDDAITEDSVQQIPETNDSFTWIVPNPAIRKHTHYGEDYVFVITRINDH